MRGRRITGIVLLLILVVSAATACNPNQSQVQQQEVQVTKGDLTIKANGSGTVGVDSDAKVSFGNGGKIVKLNVKEGDTIAKGSVLVQFDTDNLELALLQAQTAGAQAQLALTQAQANVTAAQLAQTQAEANVTNAQLAQTQAESSLAGAQFDLDRTQAVSDIKDEITEAEWQIKIAQMRLQEAVAMKEDSADYWREQIVYYNAQLAKKQKKLADLLAKEEYTAALTYDIMGQTYDRLTVQDVRMKQLRVDVANQSIEQARQNVEQAKQTVEQARQNVELAKQTVEQAKLSLDQAAKAVQVAQKQLDEATIIAPIGGTALTVNAKEGDVILSYNLNPITPIYLVNLSTIQVKAQIDEIDIAGVKPGQKAIINLDSAPDVEYEGAVKSISIAPVANPQNSGVVVYEVKIGFISPPPPEVKLGMSATVDIVTSERKGILMVPSRAIKEDDQGKTVVDVMVNKKAESRQVQTGMSDGINTEIINGLNAGETVIIKRTTESLGLFGQ
jgi:RND family efflux transporter MFP subunit